jgi:hypothetical protein
MCTTVDDWRKGARLLEHEAKGHNGIPAVNLGTTDR